jgi:uncharacterized protein
MKELVEYIVKSLVDEPEAVVVEEQNGRSHTIIELSVAQPDMGRVIGRNGRVINAIRQLLQVRAAKEGLDVTLEVLEADRR